MGFLCYFQDIAGDTLMSQEMVQNGPQCDFLALGEAGIGHGVDKLSGWWW